MFGPSFASLASLDVGGDNIEIEKASILLSYCKSLKEFWHCHCSLSSGMELRDESDFLRAEKPFLRTLGESLVHLKVLENLYISFNGNYEYCLDEGSNDSDAESDDTARDPYEPIGSMMSLERLVDLDTRLFILLGREKAVEEYLDEDYQTSQTK